MSTHYYYMLVNLGCIIVPFIFSFHPKLRFYKNWRRFLLGTVIMMAVFIPWDIYFTSVGVWGFNPEYISGLFFAGLPVEEWLFFICIPYACLFTYHCFKILIKKEPAPRLLKRLAWAIAIASLIIAGIYYERWYTCFSHLICGLLLLLHLAVLKSHYLNRFIFMYIIILIPFIICNGILTGLDFWSYSFINTDPASIKDMIVWYDNSQNLGIRFFSIPVDDVSYGLAMLLLVTTIYEYAAPARNQSQEIR